MKKKQRRQRRPAKRPRKVHKTAGSREPGYATPQSSARGLAAQYSKCAGKTSSRRSRALEAAMPVDVPLHSSNWLAEGVIRGRKASGLEVRDVIGLLEGFLGWCHRRGHVQQHDVAISLTQLEVLRRQSGAEPKAARLPEPQGAAELSLEELTHLVATWESASYDMALFDPTHDDTTRAMLSFAAIYLPQHLALAHGVPTQLCQLDPAGLALELERAAREQSDSVGPPPPGYLGMALEAVDVFYQACAERGFVERDVAQHIGAQLRGLIFGYHRPEAAA